MSAVDLLRQLGTYACWAVCAGATVAYALNRLRAYGAEGMPELGGQAFGRRYQFTTPEGRALARRASWWSVVAVLFGIVALVLSAT